MRNWLGLFWSSFWSSKKGCHSSQRKTFWCSEEHAVKAINGLWNKKKSTFRNTETHLPKHNKTHPHTQPVPSIHRTALYYVPPTSSTAPGVSKHDRRPMRRNNQTRQRRKQIAHQGKAGKRKICRASQDEHERRTVGHFR